MHLRHYLSLVLAFAFSAALHAQKPEAGSVTGRIVDKASNRPIEFAAVTLKDLAGHVVQRAATDAKGAFTFPEVPFGDYRLSYGLVGGDLQETDPVHVDVGHRAVVLGLLSLGSDTIKMQRVEVSARKEAFYNSIDRKVYNVGKDIQSANGSASDLLQNVPSVDVDIEGNVSLRGEATS